MKRELALGSKIVALAPKLAGFAAASLGEGNDAPLLAKIESSDVELQLVGK